MKEWVAFVVFLLFVSLVFADVISVNSGGSTGLIINPGAGIEGFFFAASLNLSSCGTLSSQGSVYKLSRDLSSTGTCFTIGANNITLDCQGHKVSYSTATAGYGLVDNGYDYLNLKNCRFNLSNQSLANSYGVYLYGGSYKDNITNVTVRTTSISSAGNKYNHGIYFNNVLNSTIEKSNISTISSGYTGYTNYGIYLSSGGGNTVNNNLVFTNNYAGAGIYVSSPNNDILNNNIVTKFQGSYGIYVSAANNYFSNNSVTTYGTDAGGDSSFGVDIVGGTNNIFRDNSVVTYESQSYVSNGGYGTSVDTSNLAEGKPVWYNDSLSNHQFKNINFSGYGQVICAGCNNVTYSNVTIRKDGLLFGGTSNSIIENSNIIANTSDGVRFIASSYNTIDNSNLSELQNYVNPLKMTGGSNHNTVENSYLYESSNSYGIYLQSSSYNLFYNNLIDSYGSNYGVLLYGSTDYENFTQNTFNTVSACLSLDSQTSTQSYFNNDVFNCGGSYAVYSNRGSNTYMFTNDNFNGKKIQFGTASSAQIYNLTNDSNFGGGVFTTSTSNQLNVLWYLDAHVNNTKGQNIQSANVTVIGADSKLKFTELTSVTGWIAREILREYFQNYTKTYYAGNYTMNTTKFGYFGDSRQLNMTKSRIEYVTLHGVPPIITIISPNQTNYTTLNIDFNVSVFDEQNVSTCLYSLDSAANVTMNKLNATYFWSAPSLGPGPHYLTYYCNDTADNWGSNSTNFTIENSAAISILLSPNLTDGVRWNVQYLPVHYLDAIGNNLNGSTYYYINVSAINVTVDLYVKASGNLVDQALDTLGLGNETYAVNTTDPTVLNSPKKTMSTNYTIIGSGMGDHSVLYMKFYLDAPSTQPAGVYTNNLSFVAVRHGQSPP